MQSLVCTKREEPFRGGHVAIKMTQAYPMMLGTGSELGLLGDTSFTAEATVMIRQWNTDQQGDNAIIGIDDFRAGTWHWVIRNRRVGASFYYSHDVEYSTPLELDRWYHLAVVYRVERNRNGGNTCHHSLFVDGEQVATSATEWLPPCTNPDRGHYLGRYAGGRPLNGIVTNVRIWNVALEMYELQGVMSRNLLSFPPNPLEDETRVTLSWETTIERIRAFHQAFRTEARFLSMYSTSWHWTKETHRYSSANAKERVLTVLKLVLWTHGEPRHPGALFAQLPKDVLLHNILEYLPAYE